MREDAANRAIFVAAVTGNSKNVGVREVMI
jgi:hypothetical protein